MEQLFTGRQQSEEKVASLCQLCQKAVFRDDSFKQVTNDQNGLPHLILYRKPNDNPVSPGEEQQISDPWIHIRPDWHLTDSLPDLPVFGKSMRDGCDFCKFLREIILSDDTDWCWRKIHRDEGMLAAVGACNIEIWLEYLWDDHHQRLDKLVITLEFPNTHLHLSCHVDTAPTSNPAIVEWLGLGLHTHIDIDWIQRHLEGCKTHDHPLINSEFLPERLLDVTGEQLRLVLRDDLVKPGQETKATPAATTERPKYAALSYCWGPPDAAKFQLTSTTVSLLERKAGIREDQIPLTIRDACKITKSLGISYLWVDALCILQDDRSDWDRQCVQMEKIYGCAELTLCAASSQSCADGFLQLPGQVILLPFQSALWPDRVGVYSLRHEVRFDDTATFASIHSDGRGEGSLPLFTRGWAFQERILSNAKVIFSHTNLRFVCPSGFYQYIPSMDNYPQPNYFHTAHLIQRRDEIYGDGSSGVCQMWTKLLNEYTSMTRSSFTHPSDLLPALSGLASIFHKHIGDSYYAGHWLCTIPQSLLWSKEGRSKIGRKQFYEHQRVAEDSYLVPSWSRLGHDKSQQIIHLWGPYFCPGFSEFRSELHDLAPRVKLRDKNPFGALKDCSIMTKCRTINLSVLKTRLEIYRNFDHGKHNNIQQARRRPKWHLVIDGETCLCCLNLDFWCDVAEWLNNWLWDKDPTLVLEEILESKLALMSSSDVYTLDGNFKKTETLFGRAAYGLILRAVPGTTEEFYRIGVFYPEDHDHGIISTETQDPNNVPKNTACQSNFTTFIDFSVFETLDLV